MRCGWSLESFAYWAFPAVSVAVLCLLRLQNGVVFGAVPLDGHAGST